MQELKIFKNEEFGEVRIKSKDSQAYLNLNDVCKCLEIENPRNVRYRLKEDGVHIMDIIDSMGRHQAATFINESNLYKVIFQSRKASAERFTDWVTSEVLPSIRKNGGYINDQDKLTPEQIVANALVVAQNIIRQKNRMLEEQKPKVLFADAVAASHTSILVGDLAKLIKQNSVDIGQKRLFEWLRNNGFLMTKGDSYNMPTQKSMDLGLFEVKESTINNPDGSIRITKTTKVTGKGQTYFVNKFLKELVEV